MTKGQTFKVILLPILSLIAIAIVFLTISEHFSYSNGSSDLASSRISRSKIKQKKALWQVNQHYLQKYKTRKIGTMLFVRIPSGCFLMGQKGFPYAEPLHRVCVQSFWLAAHETRQKDWIKVMGVNPSFFKHCGPDCPVENVSWNEVQDFIQKFNARYKTSMRLPSEREWEYAARAGTTTNFYWGQTPEVSRFWYEKNTTQGPQPVGLLPPNQFGLFDMSGNVAEWTQDCMHFSYQHGPKTGQAWLHAHGGQCRYYRVMRGGAWNYPAKFSQSAFRDWSRPYLKNNSDGFRLVLVP